MSNTTSITMFTVNAGRYDNAEDIDCDKINEYIHSSEIENSSDNQATKNHYLLNETVLTDVKRFCQESVNRFVNEIAEWNVELEITLSWAAITRPGDKHHPHKHGNSLFSGVYYLDDTPVPIQFENPLSNYRTFTFDDEAKNLNTFNTSAYYITPKRNSCIIFPSYLRHWVPVNNTEKIRTSIAFNTWVRSGTQIGSEEEATFLRF